MPLRNTCIPYYIEFITHLWFHRSQYGHIHPWEQVLPFMRLPSYFQQIHVYDDSAEPLHILSEAVLCERTCSWYCQAERVLSRLVCFDLLEF